MPNCGHDHTVLYLVPGCHPSRGLSAAYDKRTGILALTCKACKRPVTEVLVAADTAQR